MSLKSLIGVGILLIPNLITTIAIVRLSRYRLDRTHPGRGVTFPFDGWGNVLNSSRYEPSARGKVAILPILLVTGAVGFFVGGGMLVGVL